MVDENLNRIDEDEAVHEEEESNQVITLDDILGTSFDDEEDTASESTVDHDTIVSTTSEGPAGMKEFVIKARPRYIENPLPVPKRREHKEIDYMIDVPEDDDFILTDMSGIDFYDLND